MMHLLPIGLITAAVALYLTSPSQMLYSAHPLGVYALLLSAAAAAWLGGRGKARAGLLVLVALLGGVTFYFHSVRSHLESAGLSISVGDKFPEVTLPTSTGLEFSSTDLRGKSAALYVFYRGDWCPFCRTELSSLNDYYGQIRGAGTELIAVSVDPPEASEQLRKRLGVPFIFLANPDGSLLDRLGIRHVAGHNGGDIAYPAQILVDRSGIVRWTFRANSYRQRAEPQEMLAAIAALEKVDN